MINNFNTLKIKKDLFKLTGKKFSDKYINDNYKKIFDSIIKSGKNKIIISGSQGSGKSTLLILIKKNLKKFYNIDTLCLSLDDYYLSKKKRLSLSKKIHQFLITRGVPGTHDVEKLLKNIISFEKKKYPIYVPKFDKLTDNRKKNYSKISKVKKILFLEGWCCGSPPIEKKFLKKNINILEKKDHSYIWREYYNNKLDNEYRSIFKKFNFLIYFKVPHFKYVHKWREKQEKNLLMSQNKKRKIMNKNELNNFIMHYEKLTKWMSINMPNLASLSIELNKKQRIERVKISDFKIIKY